MKLIHSYTKVVSTLVVAALLYEILVPVTALALTSGPTQPEFSSFEPVATTNMVDEFSGAFTYNLPVLNVPGPHGSGYPLSLSYHSGASPEEEASWVGYGFTLNAGSIVRHKRGFPDDYKGAQVRHWNGVPTNWTVSAGFIGAYEIYSATGLSLGASIRYNSYKGFGYSVSGGLQVKGMFSLGYSVSDGEGSFNYSINPSAILSELKMSSSIGNGVAYVEETGAKITNELDKSLTLLNNLSNGQAAFTFSNDIRPTNITRQKGYSMNVTLGGLPTLTCLPIGIQASVTGNFTWQENYSGNYENAFGYMYSSSAADEDMMDFYSEKEHPYSAHQYYMSIPFSNADYYSIMGEGVGGGFRLYNKRPGHFHVNKKSSDHSIFNAELEYHTGAEMGLGTTVSVGSSVTRVEPWVDNSYSFAGSTDGDEPYFFRMNNDLGGNLVVDDDDDAHRASLDGGFSWATGSFEPKVDPSISTVINDGQRSKRSAYIGYSTNRELRQNVNNRFTTDKAYYRAHSKIASIRQQNDQTELPDAVGEMVAYGPDGTRYVYGQPVYARGERNLQYLLKDVPDYRIVDNHLVYSRLTPENAKHVVGEESDQPYVVAYLLTEINTPDYVDVGHNGPSREDLGAYTLFTYQRVAGSYTKTPETANWYKSNYSSEDNGWYRWRVPYAGMIYNRNKLSDQRDDMGSVAFGEKEIYYLRSIETKTHTAIFVTNEGMTFNGYVASGSGTQRRDGYEASHFEYDAAGNANATTAYSPSYVQQPNKLRRLERIELFAGWADRNNLLQTVYFEYDYSLCRGVPNAHRPNAWSTTGKLTLKRVFSDFNGTVSARISPYVFSYNYPSTTSFSALPSEVQTKYSSIVAHGSDFSDGEENPPYSPFNLDGWGNYQQNGTDRYRHMRPWVDQTPDESAFDPAAWQLKSIQLPSGGMINVQYEQNDYCYVQDKPAMTMVSLVSGDMISNKFYLNLSGDLNITGARVDTLMDIIRQRFVEGGERIYFKFLMPLESDAADLASCNVEHLTGYAKVIDAGVDGTGPWIEIKPSGGNSNPLEALVDFAQSSLSGQIQSHCDDPVVGMSDHGDAQGRVMALIGKIGETGELASDMGLAIDPAHSYLRIPLGSDRKVMQSKKGGGIRVKRLLMYDPGIETKGGGLYGSEYIYKTLEGWSSGVASNEPGSFREENAVVNYIPHRREQTWLDRLIAGRDKEEFEGPLGESLLPGPSVGYSRVVVRNIHTGKTNPGFTIHEFNTAKDYPQKLIYGAQDIDQRKVTGIKRQPDWKFLTAFFFTYSRSNVWATQGYSFILNAMHGRQKSVTTYGGDYDAPQSMWSPSASQEYEYYKPGESIPVMYSRNDIRQEYPGKEMEVTFEGRSVEDVTVDAKLQVDMGMGFCGFVGPFPYASAFGQFQYSEHKLRTHVTCKVVRYPAVVKSVSSRQDGINQTTANLGFDPNTGSPIYTRTTDGYSGMTLQQSSSGHDRVYHSWSTPAAHVYAGMGQKAATERKVYRSGVDGVTIEKRYLDGDGGGHYLAFMFGSGHQEYNLLDNFSPGDLVLVDGTFGGPAGLFYVDKVVQNRVILTPVVYSWTIPIMLNVSVEVIRSGRTNQLTAPAGAITTYSADN